MKSTASALSLVIVKPAAPKSTSCKQKEQNKELSQFLKVKAFSSAL